MIAVDSFDHRTTNNISAVRPCKMPKEASACLINWIHQKLCSIASNTRRIRNQRIHLHTSSYARTSTSNYSTNTALGALSITDTIQASWHHPATSKANLILIIDFRTKLIDTSLASILILASYTLRNKISAEFTLEIGS